MRKLLLLALTFSFLPLLSGGEGLTGNEASSEATVSGPYRVQTSIDWQHRVLVLRVALDLKAAGLRLPEGRLVAERMVGRDLPGLAKGPFFAIPVDSSRSVGDTIIDGSVDVSAILDLATLLTRREDSLSRDLSTYLSVWELPLGAATALYVGRGPASPLPFLLQYRPSKAFTGIVIFADEPLPVHGERGVEARVRDGLLPRVFDSEMNPVIDGTLVKPEALVAWGPLGYAATLDVAAEGRVGGAPLRIHATELFGINRTDLVISRDDAEKILALPENRALVAEGRVLVIVGRR
jgi:hypothetical protein